MTNLKDDPMSTDPFHPTEIAQLFSRTALRDALKQASLHVANGVGVYHDTDQLGLAVTALYRTQRIYPETLGKALKLEYSAMTQATWATFVNNLPTGYSYALMVDGHECSSVEIRPQRVTEREASHQARRVHRAAEWVQGASTTMGTFLNGSLTVNRARVHEPQLQEILGSFLAKADTCSLLAQRSTAQGDSYTVWSAGNWPSLTIVESSVHYDAPMPKGA